MTGNKEKLMKFAATNRRKASAEEVVKLLDTLYVEDVEAEGLIHFFKDSQTYPLFDAAAMCIEYWECQGKDLSLFTSRTVKFLSSSSEVEPLKKEKKLTPPVQAEIELEWGGGMGLKKEED